VNKEKIKRKEKMREQEDFHKPNYVVYLKRIKITIIFLKCSHENTLLVNEK
jgi:hypothetical protein